MSYSKNDVCNLALSCMGNRGSVENIDNPKKQEEIAFSKWFDISRRSALRQLMPSFARKRDVWAMADFTPSFGYAYAYKVRSDCVRVLGLGNLYEKKNDYSVEGGYLLTNRHHPEGLPVRYVEDILDPSLYTDDFILLWAWILADNTCMEITNDRTMKSYVDQTLPIKIMEICGVDSQENKPIRVAHSPILDSRHGIKRINLKP